VCGVLYASTCVLLVAYFLNVFFVWLRIRVCVCLPAIACTLFICLCDWFVGSLYYCVMLTYMLDSLEYLFAYWFGYLCTCLFACVFACDYTNVVCVCFCLFVRVFPFFLSYTCVFDWLLIRVFVCVCAHSFAYFVVCVFALLYVLLFVLLVALLFLLHGCLFACTLVW